MKIIINNKETEFASAEMSVTELLHRMNYTFPMIVIKINGQLVKKDHYEQTFIIDGDKVEAIHLIGGG